MSSRDDRVLRVLTRAARPMHVDELARYIGKRHGMDARRDMALTSCRRLGEDGLAHETASGKFAVVGR